MLPVIFQYPQTEPPLQPVIFEEQQEDARHPKSFILPRLEHCTPPQLDPYTKASVTRPMLPVTVKHPQTEHTLQVIFEKQQEDEECEEEECEPESSPELEASWKSSEESQSQSSQIQCRNIPSSEQALVITGHPKAFILPRLDHLSRNRMKTDRVARYLGISVTGSLRLPGEDSRKSVRWGIRQQMLYKTEFPLRSQHIIYPTITWYLLRRDLPCDEECTATWQMELCLEILTHPRNPESLQLHSQQSVLLSVI
uniref:Uncharacterized protein n=1 Tax=Sphaerodactylus townsendi TaxID=933632 RepID=A0ACB8EJS6_9SAUR